jgi:hypothetical protein
MNGTFFCNKCGAQNTAGAQFCSRCGTPTNPISGVVPTAVPSSSPAAPYAAFPASYPAVAPAAGVRYGGFWIRVVAAIIDAIILRVVVAPVGLIFGALGLAGGMMTGLPHRGLALLGGGVTLILLFLVRLVIRGFHGELVIPGDAGQDDLWNESHGPQWQPNLIRTRDRKAFCEVAFRDDSVHRLHHGRASRSASRDCTICWPGRWCGGCKLRKHKTPTQDSRSCSPDHWCLFPELAAASLPN